MKHIALLVDDEVPILTTLGAILRGRGFEVHIASSAKAAQGKMDGAIDFDLVVTDLNMENETAGYEVVRAANAMPQKPATIVMSAYASLRHDWQERGAQAAFDKPTDVPELLRTIDALLQKRPKRAVDNGSK
jgi:CheY-like chemotaxis protein